MKKIEKIKNTYKIWDRTGRSILLEIEWARKQASVFSLRGDVCRDTFMFKNSEIGDVIAIGRMIMEAGRLAKRELDYDKRNKAGKNKRA